jgi:hypothetical protein
MEGQVAVYVMLAFDDDEQAKTLVEDMLRSPGADILTPSQENNVHATVRAVYKRPTVFCDESDGHKKGKTSAGFTRGRKYGWWVCAKCGKPTKAWAQGEKWFQHLGVNLLPQQLLPEAERIPDGWQQGAAKWTFLLEPRSF